MSRSANRYEQNLAPFDDDYRGFDTDGEGARGPLILALAIGVALIFGAVIWNTYAQGVRPEAGTLPVVLADSSPYKRSPDNPGGTVAPDQDRRIYDQMDGSGREGVSAGDLGPIEDINVDQILQGGPPIELRPGQETEIDKVSGIPHAAIEQIEARENADRLAGNRVVEETLAEPVANATPTLPATIQQPAPAFAFQPNGAFLVQIAALRNQEAADAAWTNVVTDEPDLFQGADKRVQRADLGAKGVFYRLRVGAFEVRADATAFCDELKARGRACIVVSG